MRSGRTPPAHCSALFGQGGAHNGGVTRDPFDVTLGELRSHPRASRVVRRGKLEGALVADVDCRVPAGSEAEAEVELVPFDGGVSVAGKVSAVWEGECRRCLAKLGGSLVAPVREIFRRGGGPDEGTYPMREDVLNLREMVLDSLFAELPVLPLCREDCRGICPTCGTDLNVFPCLCAQTWLDPRWSALDVLSDEPPEAPTSPDAALPSAMATPVVKKRRSSPRASHRAGIERGDPFSGGQGRTGGASPSDGRPSDGRPSGGAPGW